MLQKFFAALAGLVITASGLSQNSITGIWEGRFLTPVTGLGQPKLVVEIYSLNDSLFTGVTHLYYEGNKYEHYKALGWYNRKDSALVFQEVSTIAVDLGDYINCLGTYSVKLEKKGNKLFQYGIWVANIKGCTPDVKVWLQKDILIPDPPLVNAPKKEPVKKSVQKTTPPRRSTTAPVITEPAAPITKTSPPVKANPGIRPAPVITPEKITRRETDIQSLIEIAPADKDSIKVEVYDNGEIDGDSVSVYEENIPRISRKMISARPLTFYVSLSRNVNPICHLRLVAENLGSIPPCTALMIVTTRSKRYEVRLSSNFTKNATVELFLKE